MNLLFVIFCIFFIIIGIVDSIQSILKIFFNVTDYEIRNPDEAEFIIRNFANKNLWDKNLKHKNHLKINAKDHETKKIVNIARNDFKFINFDKLLKKK